jgi:alkylation response protein AidB-like acyl-CoA dehydrogenase
MNGDKHFSEVFLTGARVPDEWRIGDVGAGWSVAMTVLAHERALAGESRGGGDGQARGQRLPRWLADVAELGVFEGPGAQVWRDRAMRTLLTSEAARLTAARSAAAAASGKAPGPAGSGAKVRKVDQYKSQAYLNKDAHGATGMLDDYDDHVEFMTAPSMSIRGGTDEIQRNILGERVLGLPGEPRVDRDVAWSKARKGVI